MQGLLEGTGAVEALCARGKEQRGDGSGAEVLVLVPAHDEEACIGEALRSATVQTRRPDRDVVVADNCTDATAEVARAAGAEVLETAGNQPAYRSKSVLSVAQPPPCSEGP